MMISYTASLKQWIIQKQNQEYSLQSMYNNYKMDLRDI